MIREDEEKQDEEEVEDNKEEEEDEEEGEQIGRHTKLILKAMKTEKDQGRLPICKEGKEDTSHNLTSAKKKQTKKKNKKKN